MNTWQVETGESGIQGHVGYSALKADLDYMKPCLKSKQKKKNLRKSIGKRPCLYPFNFDYFLKALSSNSATVESRTSKCDLGENTLSVYNSETGSHIYDPWSGLSTLGLWEVPLSGGRGLIG